MPKNVFGGGDGTGMATVHQVKVPLWPYLVTPASSALLWVGAAGAHALWGDAPGWPAVGLTLGGVGLTALAWRASAARGIVRRWVSTLATGAGSMWMLGATLSAPWSRPWLDMWLIGAPVASIAMATMRVLREGGDLEPAATPGGGLGDAVRSLRDAAIGRARIDGAKAVVPVVMEEGGKIADVARDREAIASVLDVPQSAVRVIPSPESPVRRGRVEVVPVDQLKAIAPWPGLSAPGASIALPIVLGVMEDGEPLLMWLPGDHAAGRNAAHFLVVGMSGAGKTELILCIAAEVISRADAELWIGDPRKGDQLPEWVRRGAARVATTEEDTDAMLADLEADVTRRAKVIGAHGHKQWTPRCAKCPPYRVAILDEAAKVAAGNAVITELTEAARSAGISLIFGLQRASYDRFPTSARANIAGSLCLGVDSDTDAAMALSEATLAAGASPWTWKNDFPGYLYAEIPGTDRQRWIMPCRSFFADEEARGAAVAPFLPGQPARPAPSRPDQEEPAMRRTAAVVDDQVDDLTAGTLGDPPDDVDPSKPITTPPGTPRIAFGALAPRMTGRDALVELTNFIYDRLDAGIDHVRPGDLGDVMARTGLGASWHEKALGRLCEGPNPVLRKTDRGYYKILVAQPA